MNSLSLPARRALRFASFLLVAGFGCHASVLAKTSHIFSEDGGSLEVILPNGYQAHYGYHPVRIIAENKFSKPAVWTISMRDAYAYNDPLNPSGLRQQITVPGRQRIERELLLPLGVQSFGDSYSSLRVDVVTPADRPANWSIDRSYSSHRSDSRFYGLMPGLLTERARAQLRDLPNPDDSQHGLLEPASASSDWRGYTAFSNVFLTPDDWQLMTPSARQAVVDWTRMGGRLQFVGGIPKGAPTPDVPDSPGFGLGFIHEVVGDGKKPNYADIPSVEAAKSVAAPSLETARSGGKWLTQWLKGRRDDLMNERFVVWPMVLVLLGFFVMITPVNLWVLAPSKKRHRLFRTIPILSLSSCAILALAVIFGDGIGGKGERWVWIEAQGGENRLAVSQWQASRCMAVGSTSFAVDESAYLAPISEPGSRVKLQVTGDGLDASGGWFTSRTTQSHFLQSMRPSRGRIEWTASDSAPSAVSTFDFPLRDVLVPIDKDTWWYAPEMQQGKVTRFEKASKERALSLMDELLDDRPLEERARQMASRGNHFIAFTDQPPAIDTLGAVRWKDSGVVTGALVTSQ